MSVSSSELGSATPSLASECFSPVDPTGGGQHSLVGGGDPIRTTGQKALHSEYSVALDSVDAAHTFTFEIKI